MDKAYDLKALGEKLASKGLSIAEASAEKAASEAYLAVKEWFVESAELSANVFDNLVVPFLGEVDKVVLPAIEAIDLDHDGK